MAKMNLRNKRQQGETTAKTSAPLHCPYCKRQYVRPVYLNRHMLTCAKPFDPRAAGTTMNFVADACRFLCGGLSAVLLVAVFAVFYMCLCNVMFNTPKMLTSY